MKGVKKVSLFNSAPLHQQLGDVFVGAARSIVYLSQNKISESFPWFFTILCLQSRGLSIYATKHKALLRLFASGHNYHVQFFF